MTTSTSALDIAPSTLADLQRRHALNTAAAWELPPRTMGQRWRRWDDLAAADPGSPLDYPNSATLLREITMGETEALAARLASFYGDGPGGGFLLWSAWPLPGIARFGFAGPARAPLMVRPPGHTAEPTPAELEVVEVADAAALRDFERTLVDGYPAPQLQPARPGCLYDERVLGGALRFFVGYVSGEPVGCAAACVESGLVGVCNVAVLASARGRGYGGALTLAAAQAVPELPAALQASDLGAPVYARIGFQQIGVFEIWRGSRDRR